MADRAKRAAPRLNDLLLALRRLDRRLERAVATAEAAYGPAAEADEFRGLYIDQDEVTRLLGRDPGDSVLHEPATAEDASQAAPDRLDLAWLCDTFGLGTFDAELVVVALAPEIDLRYERVYAFLQNDVTRRRPTVELALNLLCSCAEAKLAGRTRLAADAPLIRSGLVRLVADPGQLEPPLIAHYLKVDEQVVSILLGQPGLDARLARFAQLAEPPDTPPGQPAQPGTDEWPAVISYAARAHADDQPLRLYFRGRAGVGKADAARALSRSAGMGLLIVDLEGALAGEADVPELVRLALRDARLRGVVLCLAGLDALRAEAARPTLAAVLTALASDQGITVLTGSQPWVPSAAGPLGIVTVEFPVGDHRVRRRRWLAALTATGLAADEASLDTLAGRFRLTSRQIDDAVATAALTGRLREARLREARLSGRPDLAELAGPPDLAVPAGPAGPLRLPGPQADLQADLMAAARAEAGHGLAAVASKLRPVAGWDDLVLPPDVLAQLRELCQRVAASERVLGEWGFAAKLPLGRGVSALFTGPPGTGKTMGAGIVAASLGLDLYRIDLSRLVSKYIGETEKNLDRVFTAAHDANAVLLFDEADALFGKRSAVQDAHDRYANVEVAYLLQKMEEYEGVAILATNLPGNLDDAFARRLAFTVPFPFPDEAYRRLIWARAWPPQTPVADDLDLDLVARELKMSGGSIRNIGVAAAFLAAADGGRVTMRHLLHAARRECQKLGRVFPEGLGGHVR